MRDLTRRDVLALSAAAGLSAPAILRAQDVANLAFSEMYVSGTMDFSAKMQRLDGKRVTVPGYMAPPLKPDASFFVLTGVPMATCPFCEDAGNWPDNIVLVRTKGILRTIEFDRRIAVTGTLELGTDIDKDTGFVSRVRLTDAQYART